MGRLCSELVKVTALIIDSTQHNDLTDMTDQFDKRAKELLRSVPEAPDYSRQQFLRDLPQPYFERMTAADVGRHYRFLALLRREASPECAYQYHDGRAEYYIHRFDLARLRQILRGLRSGWGSTAAMLRWPYMMPPAQSVSPAH